jgi:two-component system chemotaxis response regulator CheY
MWKILVVDDVFFNRQLFVEMLLDHAVCDIAKDGKEALATYYASLEKKVPYDLILMDIAMPEMDGLECLTAIRAFEEKVGVVPGKRIPIIMTTAQDEPYREAFKLGCDDYMLKPILQDELLAKIRKLLG